MRGRTGFHGRPFHRPTFLGREGAVRSKHVCILVEGIARNKVEGGRLLLIRQMGIELCCGHHDIGARALNAMLAQAEHLWVNLAPHGVCHHEHAATLTRLLQLPRQRIEGRHADETF